ncbi:hypothetical protein [Streptomyces sp. NPDC051567]|uniref:hypothetical protein n=1 Tax=Streptomyces sp. NPDC051567 TaxID=3365660 RepID=UPI0037AC1A3F
MSRSVDGATVWTTSVGGEPVQVPATIEGVRATLTEERAAAFEAEIRRTPAFRLARTPTAWALPPQAWAEIDADTERVAAGDLSGCTPMEDLAGHDPAR